jgi:hypothetical protein
MASRVSHSLVAAGFFRPGPRNPRSVPGAEVARPFEIPSLPFTYPEPDPPPEDETYETRRPRQKSSSTEPTCDIGPETRVETRLGDFCRGHQTSPISPTGTRPEGREAPEWALVPHDSRIPSFQHSNRAPAAPDQSCKTNPISPDLDPFHGLVGSVLLTAITDSQAANPYLPGGSAAWRWSSVPHKKEPSPKPPALRLPPGKAQAAL